MLGLRKAAKSSLELEPVPIEGQTPSLLSEGCGTGRTYVVYQAKDHEKGVITFNHCASIYCSLEKTSGYEVGFVHDLYHSSEWRSLSPGRSVNLGLSAPNATTWGDIRHYKIPFGRSTVNVFATDFENSKLRGSSHTAALEQCIADLRAYQDELERIATELEDAMGGL